MIRNHLTRYAARFAWASLSLMLVLGSCGKESDTPAQKDQKTAQAKTGQPPAPERQLSAVRMVEARIEKGAPVKVRWALNLKDRKVERMWLPPAGLDVEYLIVLTERNDMIAIRRRSGEAMWWTRLEAKPTGEPFFTQYGVYFVVQSHLVALERYSGETIWRVRLPFPPAAGPVVTEANEKLPVAYVPGLDQRIYAVEVESVIWPPKTGVAGITREQFMYEKPLVRIIWRYPTFGGVAGGLAFSDGKLFAADTKYHAYGIMATELTLGKPKEVQLFRTQGPMSSGPEAIGPYIYVASRDHNLYCLDRRDLREKWRYPSGHILDDNAYAIVDPYTNRTIITLKCGTEGPLTGLNDTDGKLMWELPDGLGLVGRFHDPENELEERCIMVVANKDNTMSGHFCNSGEEIWRTSTKGFHRFAKNTIDEFVYATTADNQIIFALQKDN